MSDRTYKVSFRLISDRQDLLKIMETRRQGLEPYMLDRDDMYWAEVDIKEHGLHAELTFCIDQQISSRHVSGDNAQWTLSFQHGPREFNNEPIRLLVMKHWDKSNEKVQATAWVNNLIEGGYYAHGRWPGSNAAECPYCGSYFEKGTSHPHTWLRDWNTRSKERIIYHHRQMEKTIKELGLYKSGVSALLDIPSLEELGKLEQAVVGRPLTPEALAKFKVITAQATNRSIAQGLYEQAVEEAAKAMASEATTNSRENLRS